MNSTSPMLVHRHRQPDRAKIADGDDFEGLGLDAFDRVFIDLRLEDLRQSHGGSPVDTLWAAETVSDSVALVDFWLQQGRRAGRNTRNAKPCVVAV
jgi:hypothetical protein